MSFGSTSYGSSTYGGINAFNIFSKAISAVLVLSESKSSKSDKKLSDLFALEELTIAIKNFEKRNIESLSLTELKYIIYEFLRSNLETVSLSEQLNKSINIAISSNFSLDEASSLLVQYTRNYSETIQLAENLIKSAEKRNIESVYFSDIIYLLSEYKRSYSETLSLSEKVSKFFDKINIDSFSVSEIILLQNEFKRSFSASFTLSDLKEILNQYRKDNIENLVFVENINKKVEKTLTALFLLELSVKQIEEQKKLLDSFSLSENIYSLETQKILFSAISLIESLNIKDVLSLTDCLVLSEILSSKTETDLKFLESIFLTENSYKIAKKILSNIENISDSISLFFSNEIRLSVNIPIQSSLLLSTIKNILTNISLTEDSDKIFLAYRDFLENISLNEYSNKEFLSKRTDSVSLVDLLSISSEKELTDYFSISEEIKKKTDKIKNEIISFLDSTVKEENLRKEDLLIISEIVKKNVSTRREDSFSLIDSFHSFFSIGLLRTDGFFISESLIKKIRKQNLEQVYFSVFENKDILHKLTESENIIETLSKENSFKVADMFTITELISKHIQIPENEAILITEDSTILADKNILLNLSIAESNRKQYFAELIDEERFIDLISKSKEKHIIDHFDFLDSTDRKAERKIAPKTTLITKKGKSYLLMK
jgi:hypothetical protein